MTKKKKKKKNTHTKVVHRSDSEKIREYELRVCDWLTTEGDLSFIPQLVTSTDNEVCMCLCFVCPCVCVCVCVWGV